MGYHAHGSGLCCSIGFSLSQHKTAWKPLIFPCRGFISGTIGTFCAGGAFDGQRVLTNEIFLMSGCGQVHENVSKKVLRQVPKQKWNYGLKKVS